LLLNEHLAEGGPTFFAHACRLGAERIVSKKVDATYRSDTCPPGSGPQSRSRPLVGRALAIVKTLPNQFDALNRFNSGAYGWLIFCDFKPLARTSVRHTKGVTHALCERLHGDAVPLRWDRLSIRHWLAYPLKMLCSG
jgi:hypothetical protein